MAEGDWLLWMMNIVGLTCLESFFEGQILRC